MLPASTATMNDRHWLLRYDVSGMRSGQALQAAGLLGLHKADALTEASADTGDGADTYVGTVDTGFDGHTADKQSESDSTDDGNVERQPAEVSMLIRSDSSSTDSVIVVKPPISVDDDDLAEIANKIEQAIHKAGGQYEYSFRVSGTAAASDPSVDGLESLRGLFTDVVAESDAELVENYEDEEGMTISESRYSPLIKRTMKTSGKQSNLQLTVHRDSESTALDWVIGVPVITGDYAEAD
jgi:hypothetical protein